MMERRGYRYTIGFEEDELLENGDTMTYVVKLDGIINYSLICDIRNKKMDIHFPTNEEQNSNEISIAEDDILDLSTEGDRWEGPSFFGRPFGFGRFYNSDNALTYRGFMFEGRKICYGEEYYADCETIEYEGTFLRNMRHGYGMLYDKEGSCIFEGYWHFGSNSFKLFYLSKYDNSRLFTDNVRELFIESGCFGNVKRLEFAKNGVLERLRIGDGCFGNTDELMFSECFVLKSIVIGTNSFTLTKDTKSGNLLIHECPALELLEIGGESFCYYCNKFELKSVL